MSSLSRRRFIAAGSLTAGAAIVTGKAGAADAASPPAAATSVTHDVSIVQTEAPTSAEPIMVFISNAAHGDVTVLSGAHEVVYHDPTLVARLQRVISRAKV